MKIGLVLDDTLDRNDGVQQYVILVGSWLEKQGHDVHYLTSLTKRTDLKNVHSLGKNIKVAFNKNILAMPLPASGKNIKQLLQREQFDILHIQMPYSPFLAAKVIKYAQSSTALVGTFHIAPHSRLVSASTRMLAKVLARYTKRFHAFISVSPIAQQFAIEAFGITSTVVPNAIDLDVWRPSKKVSPSTDVIFVGRLVVRKGCTFFVQAVAQLKQVPKKIKIVGNGPQRKRLEQYVKQHHFQNIQFTGYVPENTKRQLLRESKIAIFPSTGGESFGIVLLEAMAAGVVVLAGDNPGYRSVLGATPEALFNVNATSIATKLDHYLHDSASLKKLKQKQQKLIQQYDINIVGNDIMNVYKQAKRQIEKINHGRT